MKGQAKLYDFLIILSGGAAVISGLVSILKADFWLAGTQWMLVAIVLAIYAIFVKVKTE
jgi:hypothetical protein